MSRRDFPYWKDLVVIGRCVKPHGLDGEVRVLPETDFPDRFFDTEEVFAHHRKDPVRPLKIESVRAHRSGFLVRFAGLDTSSKAEGLRGALLAVWDDELVELEEDEYWHWQLEGLTAYTPDGAVVGVVTEVVASLAHDLYAIQNRTTGQTHLVPAVRQYVPEIDVKNGRLTVLLPEWLQE